MALSQWKEAILEGISMEIEEGLVEEKNLERLENLVEILHKEGTRVPESVKEAYCQVAVECTARCLTYEGDAKKAYIEAISSIWLRRIMPLCDKVSCLVTRDLLNSCRRLWTAHNDEKACKALKYDNTKEKALVSLKRVVSELLPNLDCTSDDRTEYTHESDEIEPSEETGETEPMVDATEAEVNQNSKGSVAVDEYQDTELVRASGEETESPLRKIKIIPSPVFDRVLRDLRASKIELMNALEQGGASKNSETIPEQENSVDIPASTNSEPRLSLMERRSTAQTCEWEDSIDDSEGEMRDDDGERNNGSKRKRIVVSPMKNPDRARRAKVPWSTAETLAVLKGYEMYGPNWKRIKDECPILDRRTNGDIKDKYRVEMRRKERHG